MLNGRPRLFGRLFGAISDQRIPTRGDQCASQGCGLRSPLIACGLAAGDAAEVRETGAEGVFYGRGLVKAVEPETGWVTLAHNDIMGCMPSMEMMFRVRTADVSRDLRPGDTIDFSLNGGDLVILDAKLVSHAR
jgi:Cu/Ag efflux protein CusF